MADMRKAIEYQTQNVAVLSKVLSTLCRYSQKLTQD